MTDTTRQSINELFQAIMALDKAWSENNQCSDDRKAKTSMDVAHCLGAVLGCKTIAEINLQFDKS